MTWVTAEVLVLSDWRHGKRAGSEESKEALRGHISMGWLEEEFTDVWGWGENKSKQGLLQSAGPPITKCAASWLLFLPINDFLSNRKYLTTLAANKQVPSWTNYLKRMFLEKGKYDS